MPKEKILYVCDDKHNGQEAPLELRESVPYPENVHYGEKDSIHYYYQCPTCAKAYLAYQRMGKPLEWTTPEKEVWEKRIAAVRESRVSIIRKGLDEQRKEIEKVHKESIRQLKEIALKKEGLTKEIEQKNIVQECSIGASIGISLYPADGEDVETLLKRADSAMYRVKQTGKGGFAFYSGDEGGTPC